MSSLVRIIAYSAVEMSWASAIEWEGLAMGKVVWELLDAPLRLLLAAALAVGLAPSFARADQSVSAQETLSRLHVDGFSLAAYDEAWGDAELASADGEAASEAVQAICAKVFAAYDSVSGTVDFTGDSFTLAECKEALGIIVANPEYYWAGSEFDVMFFDNNGKPDDTDRLAYLDLTYVVDSAEVPQVKKSTETAIARALSWVDVDSASQFEVAQALHDYLVRTCAYDSCVAKNNVSVTPSRTAYGTLVKGSAVCQGYALAYKLLLARAGIRAVYVTSDDMNHAWNMVNLGGNWYHTDVTWDDPTPDAGFDADVSHDCFLRSDASFKEGGHYGWQAAYSTPARDYPNRSYKQYKGELDGEDDDAAVKPAEGWVLSGTCEWRVGDGGLLTIRPAGGSESGVLEDWGGGLPSWASSKEVRSVKFEKTVRARTLENAFMGMANLESVDFSGLDTANVASMAQMFQGCTSLTSLDASSLDTSSVTSMASMFKGCTSLATLNLSSFDTAMTKDMGSMFDQCASLQSVSVGRSFAFKGGSNGYGYFPTPGGNGLTGLWTNGETGISYRAAEIPSNVAATYIAQRSLDGSMFAIDVSDATYTGKEIVGRVSSETLKEGVDYEVSYSDNVNVGTAQILVSGKGIYAGSLAYSFNIVEPVPTFPDVDYTQWYADGVTFCATEGLMTGYTKGDDAGKFGVGRTLTRAELAAILWRVADPDAAAAYDSDADNATGMPDVADRDWYTGAANWAVAAGVINGFIVEGGAEFRPNAPVTMEQLATILANYADVKGAESADRSVLADFVDQGAISDWARGSVAWAKAKDIVNGYSEPDGRYLRPGEEVARERVAVVLMNAFESGVLE